jgi:CRISPR-associated protein Cas1
MRILKNTLYVLTSETYLALDGENIVLQKGGEELHRIPLHNLEGVVAFGYTGASPALMGACAKRNIGLTFLSMHGRFLARVVGEQYGNILLRKTQYRISDSTAASAGIARNFLVGKFFNCRWVVERAARDYSLRLDISKLKDVSHSLLCAIHNIKEAVSLDEMLGMEGKAAAEYFSVMNDFILQQKEDFCFNGRNRRPPMDRVNAMLSFVYVLLSHDTASALETVGLDPYAGFLHRDRPGRQSLALDLMEEFRAVLADRFVLTLINTRQVKKDYFMQKEDGAVLITEEGRKIILTAWQTRKQEKILHPFLNEKLEWGLVPYAQAMLLARFLRGDLDEYPPFLWK